MLRERGINFIMVLQQGDHYQSQNRKALLVLEEKKQIYKKKLAAFRSKNAAKYHLQTAITPFANLT